MTLGSFVVNLGLCLFFGGYDGSSISPTVAVLTVVMSIMSILFTRLACVATQHVDRSTMTRFSVLTIPLILMGDIALGYVVSTYQIIIMSFIMVLCFFTSHEKNVNMRGIGYIMLVNIVAACNITLFKYITTQYITVPLATLLISIVSVVVLLIWKHKDLILLLKQKQNLGTITKLGVIYGAGSILSSLAYNYGIASMVATIKRAGTMFRSLIFGRVTFHESHMTRKAVITGLLVLSIIAMQFPQTFAFVFSSQ